MTVSLWRIAAETPGYAADDLAGTGARLTGGRWNSKGVSIVYSAGSIALAILETVHSLRGGGLPLNRFLVRIDVPDEVFAARTRFAPPPGGWDAIPAGLSSISAGDAWVASGAAALAEVPSVLVPEERNVLIHPQHRDLARIQAHTVRRWHFDPRLFS